MKAVLRSCPIQVAFATSLAAIDVWAVFCALSTEPCVVWTVSSTADLISAGPEVVGSTGMASAARGAKPTPKAQVATTVASRTPRVIFLGNRLRPRILVLDIGPGLLQ